MDALTRLEPVARPLLHEVDTVLANLGAPPEHRIWTLMRHVGATPVGAVAYFGDIEPDHFWALASALRTQAEAYLAAVVPASVPWQGAAGEAYAAEASALLDHLSGGGGGVDIGGIGGAETMVARIEATASYVDDVADWFERSRWRLARVLAEILSSAQAVAVRSCPALAGGVEELARERGGAAGGGSSGVGAVSAAADIGADVLELAAECLARGRDLLQHHGPRLVELSFAAPVAGKARFDAAIHVSG